MRFQIHDGTFGLGLVDAETGEEAIAAFLEARPANGYTGLTALPSRLPAVSSLTPSPETPSTWEALPDVVRRSFEEYLRSFATESPGAAFRRSGEPRESRDVVLVPFVDQTSGASYEVSISSAGKVGATKRLG